MSKHLFVPTMVDAANLNAQVNNTREILAEWDDAKWRMHVFAYNEPDPRVAGNSHVTVKQLWRRHGWLAHMFLSYWKPWNMIVYPGVYPLEISAMRWRRRLHWPVPVLTTLEGLLGDAQREQEYSEWAGHPVHCQYAPPEALARVDERNHHACHIIAISPFLERMGRRRFGDKFSMLPLGINSDWYFPQARAANERVLIVSAGGVKANKRPEFMLELAQRFRDCDFIWYGDGDMRSSLMQQASVRGLRNVQFPGALLPAELGAALRAADVFIMPSLSEGVPKVTQEAAACGLAQVVFGYYEAPSVADGINGFVVWSDDQFVSRVGELCENRLLIRRFAEAGIAMAQEWSWRKVAKQWQTKIIEVAENHAR